eukprot:871296_1
MGEAIGENLNSVLQEAEKIKGLANESFKRQEFGFATQGYTRALKCFQDLSEDEKDSSTARSCLATLRCNRAFAFLKQDRNPLAEIDASEAIKLLDGIRTNNEANAKLHFKAMFRLVQSLRGQFKFDQALEALKLVLADPGVSAIHRTQARKDIHAVKKERGKHKFGAAMNVGDMPSEEVETTGEEQKKIIDGLMSGFERAPHAECYVVSARWWAHWQWGTVDTNAVVPKISNGKLVNEINDDAKLCTPGISVCQPSLRADLSEGRDYLLLPTQAWKKLEGWFGADVTIKRVLVKGQSEEKRVIEMGPSCITAQRKTISGDLESVQLFCSLSESVTALKRALCMHFVLMPTHARLRLSDATGSLLADDVAIDETTLRNGSSVYLEERLPHGQWPIDTQGACGSDSEEKENAMENGEELARCAACFRGISNNLKCSQCLKVKYCSKTHQKAHWEFHKIICKHEKDHTERKGMAGLRNMGNTCYINTIVQCLSHTPELSRYFVCNDYEAHINETNLLGHKGRLARAFRGLMCELWFGDARRSSLTPSAFRSVLCQLNRDFAGFQQHDAQEFLSFLLDGLHEDLNTVHQKPYIELKDSDGRPDIEVADEQWIAHMRRNQSQIVSFCQGQFKSTLMCPKCDRTNVRFDPFLTISLPLPDKDQRTLAVTFQDKNGSRPAVHHIVVSESGTVEQIKVKLAKIVGLQSHQILLAEVIDHRIRRSRHDGRAVDTLSDVDLNAFEVNFCVRDQRHEAGLSQVKFALSAPLKGTFGRPFVADFKKLSSGSELYEFVRKFTSRFRKDDSEFSLHFLKNNSAIEDNSDSIKLNDRCTIFAEWPSEKSELLDQEELEAVDGEEPPKGSSSDHLNLSDCLELFTAPETLGEGDSWFCSRCKEHVQASKKMCLWRLPDIMVFHLKRFKHDVDGRINYAQKISARVEFPLKGLDLSEYIPVKDAVSPVYDLYAVSNHYGDMSYGHYTAFIKTNEEWFHFDDSKIQRVKDETDIVSNAAYILFYRRRNT